MVLRPRIAFNARLKSNRTLRSRTVLGVAGRASGRGGPRYKASSFRRMTVAAAGTGVASRLRGALPCTDPVSGPWKIRTESPTRIWSPGVSVLSFTGTPLTKVLLRLSRSCSRNAPASLRITQWRRETSESKREISFEGSRPIDTSSLASRNSFPLRGPLTASSRAAFPGARACSAKLPMTE